MFLIFCGRLYPPCDFHTFPLYTERHLFSQTLCRARAISLIVSEAFSIVRRLSSLKSDVWLVSVLEVVAIISPIIWFCLWGIPILWFLYGLFSSLYPFWLLLTWSKFLKLGFFFIFGRLPNFLEFWLVWLSVYFIFFKRDEISLVYLVWHWKKRNFSVCFQSFGLFLGLPYILTRDSLIHLVLRFLFKSFSFKIKNRWPKIYNNT